MPGTVPLAMTTRAPDRAARRAAERATRRASERRRIADAQRRRDRRRRRWAKARRVATVAIAAAATIAVVVVGVGALRAALRPGPGTLPPTSPMSSYRLEDDVTYTAGHVTNHEVRTIERPYHVLTLTYRNGALMSGQMTNDQGLYLYNNNTWALVSPGNQLPADDPQPAPALRMALQRGLARVTGHRTVIGRPCTMVRTGSPLGEAPLKKITRSNHADFCLDATGVILDYTWTLNGKVAQRTRATSFEPQAPIPAATFGPPSPLASQQSAVQARPLSDQTRANLTPKLAPPTGYDYAGGWVRVTSVGQSFEATTTELLLHGPTDLISVDYSSGAQTTHGLPVDLGGGHTGYLSLGLEESSFVVVVQNTVTVAIRGNVPSELVDLGHHLQF
jgi:hypothetical protein